MRRKEKNENRRGDQYHEVLGVSERSVGRGSVIVEGVQAQGYLVVLHRLFITPVN